MRLEISILKLPHGTVEVRAYFPETREVRETRNVSAEAAMRAIGRTIDKDLTRTS